jgi:hypothetical protein
MDILERARAEIEATQEPHTPSGQPLDFADAAVATVAGLRSALNIRAVDVAQQKVSRYRAEINYATAAMLEAANLELARATAISQGDVRC